MKWSSYHHDSPRANDGNLMSVLEHMVSFTAPVLPPPPVHHDHLAGLGPQAFQHGEVSWNHQLLDTRKIQKVWKSFESFKHHQTSSKPKVLSSLGFLRGSVTSSGHAWPASSLVSGTGGWDCWARRCNTVLSMLWKHKTVWCILDRQKNCWCWKILKTISCVFNF